MAIFPHRLGSSALLVLILLLAAGTGRAQKGLSGNPIVPGDFADPCLLQYRDTFYLYATTGREATVWRSADFVNWKLTKLNWPTSMGLPDVWAPAVRRGTDGRFYLYTSTNHNIYAGVARHPLGPFTNLLGGDSIFIRNRQWWDKMHTIDADLFIDDDGAAYLYWGSGFDFRDGLCAVGLLERNMSSFRLRPKLITPDGYFEGPHMLKRRGRYYLMYSDGLYYDSTYKVRYAVSDRPMGPFRQGKNSPILASTPDGRISGPGHHYTFSQGDQHYIVYHRHVYPYYKGVRQVCIDRLEFEPDGSIRKVTPTQTGVPLTFVKKESPRKRLVPVSVTASSSAGTAYEAGKAFDGSYGTLWATESAEPATLTADFGRSIRIRRCLPVFDRVMGAYQYTIQYSADGKKWSLYASGNNGTAREWPVEHAREVTARYIRIQLLNRPAGAERTGLWELQVY